MWREKQQQKKSFEFLNKLKSRTFQIQFHCLQNNKSVKLISFCAGGIGGDMKSKFYSFGVWLDGFAKTKKQNFLLNCRMSILIQMCSIWNENLNFFSDFFCFNQEKKTSSLINMNMYFATLFIVQGFIFHSSVVIFKSLRIFKWFFFNIHKWIDQQQRCL